MDYLSNKNRILINFYATEMMKVGTWVLGPNKYSIYKFENNE